MAPGQYVLTEFDAGATVRNVVRNEPGDFSPGRFRILLSWNQLEIFEPTDFIIAVELNGPDTGKRYHLV